jgi:broad specificity phosphatase PhoE
MSELVLVRHGQASFGAASYDKLSEKGVDQVRCLYYHWKELGYRFDHLYCGSLQRQKETAYELQGLLKSPVSKPSELIGLNEYNGDPLLRIYARDKNKEVYDNPVIDLPIREPKLFQRTFEEATAKWINGSLIPTEEDNDFEFWSDFKERVNHALDEIMGRHCDGSKVLIATSGGVIAVALQKVLQFSDRETINTNWMVHNSSVSRIRYGKGRLSLAQFNNLPHLERLEKQDMITYR